MNKRINKQLLIFLLVILSAALFLSHCSQVSKGNERQIYTFKGQTMGTFYTIKVILPDSPAPGAPSAPSTPSTSPASPAHPFDQQATWSGIEQVLQKVNQQMSTYIPDSEISRFNKYQGNDWFPVSPEVAYVVDQALKVSECSGGAFDITVGPLVNLWGFGPEQRPTKIPSNDDITNARQVTGYRKLQVQPAAAGAAAAAEAPAPAGAAQVPALKKEIPGVYCDLAGIAKGYGVDQVALYLESCGFAEYLVEIGGEVRSKGKNKDNQWWRLGVITPDGQSGIQRAFPLVNASMATSGDYFNYFEKDGVRYSHTIDPATGKPITHSLASVTVIAPTCVYADAMATAINVLGPDKGYALAMQQNLAVMLILKGKGENGFIEKMTPQFQAVLTGPEK